MPTPTTEHYFHIELVDGRMTDESKAIEAWLTTLIDAAPFPLVGSLFGLHSPELHSALTKLKSAGWSERCAPAGDAIPGYSAALLLHHIGVSTNLRSKFSQVAQQVQRAGSGPGTGTNARFGDGSVRTLPPTLRAPAFTTVTPAVLVGLLLPAVQKVRAAASRAPVKKYHLENAWPK